MKQKPKVQKQKSKVWLSKQEHLESKISFFWLKNDKEFIYRSWNGCQNKWNKAEKSEFSEMYLDNRDCYVAITEEELAFLI